MIRTAKWQDCILNGRRTPCQSGQPADGHPAEIMDLSFAMQTLAVWYLLGHGRDMKPAVYTLPHELDTKVAQIKLQSMGYKIDSLSEEQKKYLGLD